MNFNMTLIGQSIAFAIFVWFTMKFVWPVFMNKMAEREQRIADGLAAAEQGQKKFNEAEKRYEELAAEGKQKASDIITQANKRGDEVIEESKQAAREEAERIKKAAQADVEHQVAQARETLKNEVAKLALAGAEQILMREVDQRVHSDMLEKISAKL
ncbi:MAG: F0F1 ATP synthase subunit B [Gammaproteobacteria bacterium]